MLLLNDVEHRFGAHQALAPVSLRLAPGRCVALVGPSGCGKTTLLRLAAGLLDVQKGSITSSFARCAVMFQQPLLLPWLTVLDNIALGLKAQRVPRAERQQRAADMAAAMGLEARALRQFPQQFSGGMQSRAALARALVVQPDALLLDEPFAALDIGLKAHMHRLLQQQRAQRPLAALLITHDVT
ncbi:MAG: ATP-binding cassette domain-containing protein, partial [Ottowia sp.]|nr:ATP-binding cassette domain-containing protein [Ottowia sp.]